MHSLLLSILLCVQAVPSALHQAAERGDAAEVARILRAGGDATERGERGITPLHAVMGAAFKDARNRSMAPRDERETWSTAKARARDQEAIVRLLLERGADPKVVELSDEEWSKVRAEIRKQLQR